MERKLTKKIMVGSVPVGGGAPVSIQSMLNTRTTDVDGCLAQIRALAAAGCEIARLAVPDMEAAEAFGAICAASPLPLVADIHFDYRLAIRAAENGAAKIRINPGNIGGEDRVRAVVEACGARGIPIRVGVNGGSLEPRLLEKYGRPTPEALVESAFGHIALLEKWCGIPGPAAPWLLTALAADLVSLRKQPLLALFSSEQEHFISTITPGSEDEYTG